MIAPLANSMVTVTVVWGGQRRALRGTATNIIGAHVSVAIPPDLERTDLGPGDEVGVDWHHDRGAAASSARVRRVKHAPSPLLILELVDSGRPERRSRIALGDEWSCAWDTPTDRGDGFVMDLSIGGARISLAAGQPELGDRITVAIHQDDGPDIRITGRVVATWVDDQQHRTEASVRFEDLALEEFLAVGELMRSGAPMSGDPR